ncbi:MAG: D-alanyl-D-alanine carboxypeptidase [Clostridia bacterium]|nr:D-alanyl-D-alanine carboxypeptidase [Clostridia bacterium]
MRKMICLILSVMFVFIPIISIAASNIDAIPVWSETIEVFNQIQNKVDLKLNSEAAILMDEDTGTILYTKNEHKKLRPASVTKVMTLLLIMEALDAGTISLTDKVPCSARASAMGGSQIWLDETEELTVNEMLKAICIVSANDCCVAMAELLAGSEEAFVEKMNARAKELGMNDTTFKNCHGIDEDGHVTSAYDIAIMSRELSYKHPEIHEYTKIWMDTLRDGKSELVNTNKLIRFYSGATGLKTGSTSLALFNLSATATRNDMKLIAVVMKGPTSQQRFDDAKVLLDYGFANYASICVNKKGDVIQSIEIPKSKQGKVDFVIAEDYSILVNKADKDKIEKEILIDENIAAPLEYLQKVGTISYKLNGEIIAEGKIVSGSKVEEKRWDDYFAEVSGKFFKVGR